MGMIVPTLHIVAYQLHAQYLSGWARAVLLPAAQEWTGLGLDRLCWLCVLAGVLLVLLTFEVSLLHSTLTEKVGYDGSLPRTQYSRSVGLGARLYGAHQNALEDIPAFGLAVACAMS